MIGRYGTDHLNVALVLFSLILTLVLSLFNLGPYVYAAYLPMIFAIFRMLSRNIARRRAENDRFLRIWWPIRTKLGNKLRQLKDKNHRYFRCPACHSTLRVPKGKGKIQITCPKCGERFSKKS